MDSHAFHNNHHSWATIFCFRDVFSQPPGNMDMTQVQNQPHYSLRRQTGRARSFRQQYTRRSSMQALFSSICRCYQVLFNIISSAHITLGCIVWLLAVAKLEPIMISITSLSYDAEQNVCNFFTEHSIFMPWLDGYFG